MVGYLLNLQTKGVIKVDDTTPLILGRGDVTGCSDKRVSRSHGQLICVGNRLKLTAMHTNPWFYMKAGTPPVVHINKDQDQLLVNGDYISLLPNTFWYEVQVKGSEDSEPQNTSLATSSTTPIKSLSTLNSNVDTPNKSATSNTNVGTPNKPTTASNANTPLQPAPTSNTSIPSNQAAPSPCKTPTKEAVGSSPTPVVPATSSPGPVPSPSGSDKGIPPALPAWMYASTRAEPSPSKTPTKAVGSVVTAASAPDPMLSPSSSDEDIPYALRHTMYLPAFMYAVDGQPIPGEKRPKTDQQASTPKKAKVDFPLNTPSAAETTKEPDGEVERAEGADVNIADGEVERAEGSDMNVVDGEVERAEGADLNVADGSKEKRKGTTEETEKEETKKEEDKTEEVKKEVKKEGYESDVEEAEDSAAGNTSRPQRPLCQYEASCYRKNADHKADFAHPGDPDFVRMENRPICPFGAACYRQNRSHRVSHQHPIGSRPAPRPPGASPSPPATPPRAPPSPPAAPLPAKRKRKAQPMPRDSSDEDEYDLEDPFLNDGSSDEYVPEDSDDDSESQSQSQSQEENVKRLKKEANRFIHGRKK